MSRLATTARLLRTARHLRASQAIAQLRHLLAGAGVEPVRRSAPAPALALRAPAAAFLPPPPHVGCSTPGGADGEIWLHLLGRTLAFRGGVDWETREEGPLFAYHLHQHDYLRAPAVPPAARLAVMLDWIEAHGRGVGWDPHPTSQRIFAWGKLLLSPELLSPGAGEGETIRSSLAAQVETLSRHLEVRLQANHLFTNLAALVFGGLLFEGGEADRWLRRADAFRAQLRAQVHPDGAHEERSPMYHALLLEQVLDLLNVVRAASHRAPPQLEGDLEDAAGRMGGALELWTHPDGEIALFADSALGVASPPSRLADYAASLGVALRGPAQPGCLDGGGYVRLADGCWHLIASTAGPAPAHQPGHAHGDALAFELCCRGRRVVTDTGVFEYEPGPLRDTARATRSHATLELDRSPQAEFWHAHRVGGRPQVQLVDLAPGSACEATCRGWATPGIAHTRRFELAGGDLVVRDRLEGPPCRTRFALPLAPGLDARLARGSGGGPELRIRLDPGEVRVDLPGGSAVDWRLEVSDYFPSFGQRQRRWCLVGTSQDFTSGAWRFRLVD